MLAQVETLRLRFRRTVAEAETRVREVEQQVSEMVLRETLEVQEMLPELRAFYREIEAWKTMKSPASETWLLGEDLREVSLRMQRTQAQVSRLGELLALSEADRQDQEALLGTLQEQLQEKDRLLSIQNQWLQTAAAQEGSLQSEITSLRETITSLEVQNSATHTERRRYQDSLLDLEQVQDRLISAHDEEIKNVQMAFLQDLARAKMRWEQDAADLGGKTQTRLRETQTQLEDEVQARAVERARLQQSEKTREELWTEAEELKARIAALNAQLADKEIPSPTISSPVSLPVPPSHRSVSEPVMTPEAFQAVIKSLQEENLLLKQRSGTGTPRPQPFSRDSLPELPVPEAEMQLQTLADEK